MKLFLLLGGFGGFSTTLVSGLAAGNDISVAVRNAAVGCLVGAFLMRGFRMLLSHHLRQLAKSPAATKRAEPAPLTPSQP